MRHFADELRARGRRIEYIGLDSPGNSNTLAGELRHALSRQQPRQVVMTAPG